MNLIVNAIAVLIIPLAFLYISKKSRKSKMFKDPSDYWEKFYSETTRYFDEVEDRMLFTYNNSTSGDYGYLENVKCVKKSNEKCFSNFKSFLKPYIEMSIDWHEKRFTTNSVYDRCGDKLLIISKLKIIEYCKEDDNLYEKIKYLRCLICEIDKIKNIKKIKSRSAKWKYKLFNHKCKD